ncbi:MAG: hypothetical protein FWC06_03105 [Treponema sp.]|nr:hypothetical protein [Treponema sp.]
MNIYLKKENGTVKVFYSEEEMVGAGYTAADKIVAEEEFNSNGCYTRIINGEIIVGRTVEEIEAEERAEKISEVDGQLEALDRKYLTPRVLGGIGIGDEYAIGERNKHEQEAAPLRVRREELIQSA